MIIFNFPKKEKLELKCFYKIVVQKWVLGIPPGSPVGDAPDEDEVAEEGQFVVWRAPEGPTRALLAWLLAALVLADVMASGVFFARGN